MATRLTVMTKVVKMPSTTPMLMAVVSAALLLLLTADFITLLVSFT